MVVLYFNHILFSNYQLLLNLFFVWLIFRALILIARLVLLERVSDSSGTDVRLYYRIKWLLLAGGWATALMVISHLLPLSMLLQDIFNRLFMLFLLAVSIVGWKNRETISHLLHPVLKTKKRYFRNAVMLLVVLIPLTLFTTAVIGQIGYINLAWSMSRYEVQILLILTCYVVTRGLLIDALELFSEWMISSMRNGWLWIEVFLKPLDKILRVLLIGFSLYILCQLFGLHSDSVIIANLLKFGEYPLVNLSGVYITPFSIIAFLILLSVFAWSAKWTREFGYRWLYRNARDAGIRNSLSVFTQYAVILVGGFITLRVLGLDFSGMSMVIGGLAVGMGFGLRDFASNVVGGLMLLIERPVREGDLITLGTFEGRVAHIGIRSMRVCSWDNTEVLIPNAETFNKPFTNWTHQDSIVRTVIPIKVSRADDPVMIQQLILDVLAIIPEIVSDPAPQVFLKQIDDALIEFEIRYFINVQTHTRFEIRSKVLFAITSQFKAAGVKAPIPPISVELKEGEHAPIISKRTIEE
ncbi:mechanosensitive ion channel family protein [Legionella hackeliae]|uniref:Putative mechanosensitive ion channel MscS n=4 Tax=Legionella hackeliae TaxID=449 RepID=A0A0A8UVD7_LEGHA|nr:mechanosensitive ion channel domain-containing protein [Legionella hackeliae]CEK10724.1 Putative mechanosensitive ion channel MscS [Legionella hackeliae]